MPNYQKIAQDSRKKVLELIFKAGTSHVGSCFSAIDIMTVLFEKADIEKNELILSCGWKAAAWYYFLFRKGIITEAELNSFCQQIECNVCQGDGMYEIHTITPENIICPKCKGTGKIQSPFIGLTEPMGRWGLKFAGGSMQMGTAAAVGFALSKKLKNEDGTVYCLESDGGIDGGIFWESILIAAHHKLDNLVLILDCNGFQAMGKKNEILNVEPIKDRLKIFGWHAYEIDGHNFEEIEKALNCEDEKPTAIIARTHKGYPISFMTDQNLFHYKSPSFNEYERAKKELNI